MEFENYERYNMIECYVESGKNKDAAANLYFQRYPERRQPNCKIFQRLETNLCQFGTFCQPRSKTYSKGNKENETIDTIGYITAHPEASTREIERNVGVSQTKSVRILKNNKFRPYVIRKVHNLHLGDEDRRVMFCTWYLNKIEENEYFSREIIWTDEAHITSEGIFNRNNNHFWSDINPHQNVARIFQGRFGFHVWVALRNNSVFAYHIYQGNLNANLYKRILEDNIIEQLDNMPLVESNRAFFQQDGAPAHNSHLIREVLNTNFGENWMGTNGPIRWPARSPDLTPLDFYFWGDLKNRLYKIRSNNLNELRENFENSIQQVPNIAIFNATQAVTKRCRKCIEQNGRQFEHFL